MPDTVVVNMRTVIHLLLVLTTGEHILVVKSSLVNQKIVGGQSGSIDNYPWYVALVPTLEVLNKRPDGKVEVLCGASLISPKYLVTASHCYYGLRQRGGQWFRVLTAVFLLSNRCNGEYEEAVPVAKVEMHPRYDPNIIKNDIAIVILERTVSFEPVKLPVQGKGRKNTKAIIIGYGNTEEGSNSQPCQIKEAIVNVYTRNQCLRTLVAPEIFFLQGVICAGARDGSRDTCQGDSGGPMVYTNQGETYLQGITSFGNGCGRRNSPGVYTDVSFYRRWIDNKISGKVTTTTTTTTTTVFRPPTIQQIMQSFGNG